MECVLDGRELATMSNTGDSLIQCSPNLVAEVGSKGNPLGKKLGRLPKNPGYLYVWVCCPA